MTQPIPDDANLAVLNLLEPAAATAPIDYAIQLSYAISLRRIADALCEPVGVNGEPAVAAIARSAMNLRKG